MNREKVIKGLEQFRADLKPFCGNHADWERFDAAIAMIKEQETANVYKCQNCGTWVSAENVVRCKDCKHIKKLPIDHHGHQPYWCENLNIYTEGLCWFCADGERR